MSWMPEFEIAVLTAWISMVILYVVAFAPLAITSEMVGKRTAGEPSGDYIPILRLYGPSQEATLRFCDPPKWQRIR